YLVGKSDSTPVKLTAHTLGRRLAVGELVLGEIRVDFESGEPMPAQQQHALSAYADAVASALHDAGTRRQLRLLAEHSGYEAVHDSLTGLYHRSSLLARGAAMLSRLDPSTPVGLAVFDVVGLREVNGTLGTAAGDELLRTVARRLTSEARRHTGERAESDL